MTNVVIGMDCDGWSIVLLAGVRRRSVWGHQCSCKRGLCSRCRKIYSIFSSCRLHTYTDVVDCVVLSVIPKISVSKKDSKFSN